jgi:cytochrome c nitrite reductase small subunit
MIKPESFLNKVFVSVFPPGRWRLPVVIMLGILTGLVFLIVQISNAPSYLSDKPETCMNCHVMTPQYATWQRGSHGRVTVCNDCHVPHDNIFNKYRFKMQDGLRHSFIFTFRMEPQVIRVLDPGINVIQENCIRCHQFVVQRTSLATVTGKGAMHGEGKLCWECHRETPHGRVASLASVPYARVPRLSSVLPEWLKNYTGSR